MIRAVFFILLLALFGNAQADNYDNSLSGKITDEKTGTPLAGATVFIPDLKAGTVADANGHYVLKGVAAGTFLVEVRYTGYASRLEKVRISGATQKDWTLSASVVEANEVVVTGVSQATEVRKAPTNISVLNYRQLQQTSTDNVIGKITQLPGVNAVTTGPNVMKPVIRGLGYNRVVVVDDGIRQEGQQWGDEHGIEVDDYSVGKIEVMRGPSSLMYGSDAIGGVVNMMAPDPVPEGHINGNVEANYQTNNGLVAYHGDVAGNSNGFNWRIYGTGKMAHDYQNKYDGYVFNSKFKEEDFGASIGLNKDWGYSRISYSSYDLHLGLPEGERDSATGQFIKEVALDDGTADDELATHHDFMSYEPYISRQRVQHQKITWDSKIAVGEGNIGITLGYQGNRRREYEDVLAPDEPGLFMKLHTFDYNLRYALPDMNGWQTTAGANGMQQQNENAGSEVLIPAYHLFDVGVFVITQKNVNRWTFSGGLRFDNRSIHSEELMEDDKVRFTAFDKSFSSISGSAGLSYAAGEHWIIKANAARGFRAPSVPELSSNGVHDGTIRYEIGNLDLKPENSTEFDAGVEFNSMHVSGSLYGYYNTIDHYIYSRKLEAVAGGDSIRSSEDGDFAAYQFEQHDAHLYGIEAALDIHPHPLDWLHFKNTFSFVRGISSQATDSTRNLPMMPAMKWLTELGFNFPRTGKTLRNVYLTLRLNNTFAQHDIFSAYGTETPTPAYTLLDMELGTDVVNKKGNTLFSLYLSVDNLTDVAYQDHLSRFKYLDYNYVTGRQGIYNMGRNFSFKVAVPLRFK